MLYCKLYPFDFLRQCLPQLWWFLASLLSCHTFRLALRFFSRCAFLPFCLPTFFTTCCWLWRCLWLHWWRSPRKWWGLRKQSCYFIGCFCYVWSENVSKTCLISIHCWNRCSSSTVVHWTEIEEKHKIVIMRFETGKVRLFIPFALEEHKSLIGRFCCAVPLRAFFDNFSPPHSHECISGRCEIKHRIAVWLL